MTSKLIFGKTIRGHENVLYGGFEYVQERENKNGTVTWCCSKRKTLRCRGRITTCRDRVVSSREPLHNHSGNMTTSLAKTAVQMMKARMKELNATPATVQAAVLPTLTNDGVAQKTNS